MGASYQEYLYSYAHPTWTGGYLQPQLLQLIGQPNGKLLNLGCGNGAIARHLLLLRHDAYGVDASVSAIAIANREFPGRFFVADLSSGVLPAVLSATRFRKVVSTKVIEHLYRPTDLVTLAKSHSEPRGRLIISTPYHGYMKIPALAVIGAIDAHFTALWGGGHIKFFSRKTLSDLLRSEGFEIEAFAGAGRLPPPWKSMIICARLPA